MNDAHNQTNYGSKQIEAYAEAAADWFWEMDRDLRFTYHSAGYERVTGNPLSTRIGKTRRELIEETHLDQAMEEHLRLLDERKPFQNFIYRAQDREDQTLWVSICGTPMFNDDGDFEGYLGAARVVNDQVEREEQLRLARLNHYRLASVDLFG